MIPLATLDPFAADATTLSPNHGERRADAIQGVVLHATADGGNERGSLEWLRNPQAQASAHLLFHRDGRVTRLVEDRDRAWHAGASEWRGSSDVNSITLGWEIANRNDGQEEYTDAQYAALALAGAHYAAQGLTPADFVAHAEVAPGRKNDPLGFDWERFREKLARMVPAPALAAALSAGPEMILEPIEIPTTEHVERAAEAAGVEPSLLVRAAPALELVLKAVTMGAGPREAAIARHLLGALAGYRERHGG